MESREIFPLVLADGPAGLRLQPHFKTTADGKLLRGGEIFGLNAQPFQDDIPDDAVDYYQYCTAIPIANTLAQSWDMDLIQKWEVWLEPRCRNFMSTFGLHLE